MRFVALVGFCLSLILTGCGAGPTAPPAPTPVPTAGVTIRGSVHDGQQPIAGAHVYLMAANTTGYGSASVSLLSASSTGLSDAVGAYVTTDSTGSFSIMGNYTCAASAQTYLYVLGGNPGNGVNPASGLLALLGNCPTSSASVPTVWVNEVSTVAAAYAIAGFAIDPTHVSSSGSALAQTGIANAFLNATNLVNLATGTALTTTPASNGVVPQPAINTLANALAACVSSTGTASPHCSTLFSNALAGGSTGTAPTDTASAALNIAHNPGTNVANLYNLAASTSSFTPVYTTTPGSFSLSLAFTYPGIKLPNDTSFTIGIDASGNVWIPNNSSDSVTELSSTGAVLSPNPGYTGGGLKRPIGISIDTAGNVSVTNTSGPSVTRLSHTGAAISPASGYTDTAMNNPLAVAMDGSGNAWVANNSGASITKLSASGATLSPASGYTGGGLLEPVAIAIDGTGNVWTANISNDSVSKFSSAGAPISPASGYTGGSLLNPIAIAIDASGDAWIANTNGSNSITELSSSGVPVSPTGYTGGGLSNPAAIAIDGSGNVLVANFGASFSKFSNHGIAISPSDGYIIGPYYLGAIAVDGSGNVWLSGDTAIIEAIGAATPVVTPLATGVANNTLGTRP